MNDCDCSAPKRNGKVYDVIVVGAGSAGFSAAITAGELGAQVALIGGGTIGGTCVNVGCVPSKALIRAVELVHQARSAGRFDGITAAAHVEDWQATVRQKNDLVTNLRQSKYTELLPAYNGIAYREGTARLAEGGVNLHGEHVAAGKIIIASGSRPAIPAMPGIESVSYLTSTTALELQALPRSLLIVGGGYIGAELAQMFARAGVAVTLVFRSRLLPEAEPEIGAALQGYFADEGITVIGGATYDSTRKTAGGVALDLIHDGHALSKEAEQVLITTGRAPNSGGLGLAALGIKLAANGGIIVDDRMRTTCP